MSSYHFTIKNRKKNKQNTKININFVKLQVMLLCGAAVIGDIVPGQVWPSSYVSESNQILVVLYIYRKYGQLSVQMTMSSSVCMGLLIEPCHVIPASSAKPKDKGFYIENIMLHTNYRDKDIKCRDGSFKPENVQMSYVVKQNKCVTVTLYHNFNSHRKIGRIRNSCSLSPTARCKREIHFNFYQYTTRYQSSLVRVRTNIELFKSSSKSFCKNSIEVEKSGKHTYFSEKKTHLVKHNLEIEPAHLKLESFIGRQSKIKYLKCLVSMDFISINMLHILCHDLPKRGNMTPEVNSEYIREICTDPLIHLNSMSTGGVISEYFDSVGEMMTQISFFGKCNAKCTVDLNFTSEKEFNVAFSGKHTLLWKLVSSKYLQMITYKPNFEQTRDGHRYSGGQTWRYSSGCSRNTTNCSLQIKRFEYIPITVLSQEPKLIYKRCEEYVNGILKSKCSTIGRITKTITTTFEMKYQLKVHPKQTYSILVTGFDHVRPQAVIVNHRFVELKIWDQTYTWAEALHYCREKGYGDLLSINRFEELHGVIEALSKAPYKVDFLYIGTLFNVRAFLIFLLTI